jgi:hypothetical protein
MPPRHLLTPLPAPPHPCNRQLACCGRRYTDVYYVSSPAGRGWLFAWLDQAEGQARLLCAVPNGAAARGARALQRVTPSPPPPPPLPAHPLTRPQEHEKSELQAEAQRKGRTSYSLRAAIKSFVSQFFYMWVVSRGGGPG